MKKISKIILTIVLLFTFSLNVKAVTITTDNTKQGTVDTNSYLVTNKGDITINNIESDTFKGYKIIDFYYNSTTDTLSYEFTSNFKAFLATTTDYKNLTVDQYKNLTSGDTTNYSTQTNSTLDTLVSQYATYIASNNVTGNNLTTTPQAGVSRGYATGNFDVGSYLVLPVNTSKVYAVMVGNIDLKKENNTWTVENVTINAKVSTTSITKTIVNGATLNDNKYYINATNEITNRLTITVPEFPTNATNHDLEIYEKLGQYESINEMSYGLGFVSTINNIIIKDGTQQLTITDINNRDVDGEGTLIYNANLKNTTNNEMVGEIISFAPGGLGSANLSLSNYPYFQIKFNSDKIQSDTITIEYKIKLETVEDFLVGKEGFKTTDYLCVGSSYDDETQNCGDELITTFYSYGIKITTKDGSNNNLSGASYKLYSDSTLNTEIGSFTTDGAESTIIGLAPGTYYAKQTTSPSGATINNETFTVNVPETQEGYVELTVTNSNSSTLPVTGGTGTLMFFILGLFVIGGAVVYYKFNNALKKNAEV